MWVQDGGAAPARVYGDGGMMGGNFFYRNVSPNEGYRMMRGFDSDRSGRTPGLAYRYGGEFAVSACIVAAITLALAWTFMTLGIIALIRHLKKKNQ